MTDTTRDLLISLASHMAYMQGQLEAHREHDDPEDYYWYRESVRLRQKVTDVLADEPAVPGEGREPASVTSEPSNEELADVYWKAWHEYHDRTNSVLHAVGLRAVLARWGNQPAPPADGEVAELVEWLCAIAADLRDTGFRAERLVRAAELLQRQALVPVSVSERPPEGQLCWWFEPDEEDDEAYGSSWTLLRICGGTSSYTHWLPAHALPLPEVNNG